MRAVELAVVLNVQLLYEHGTIVTHLSFAELRKLSNINAQAKAADTAADF